RSLRLSAVRRGTAHVHRRRICAAGSHHRTRDHYEAFHARARAGPNGLAAAAVHLAAARSPDDDHDAARLSLSTALRVLERGNYWLGAGPAAAWTTIVPVICGCRLQKYS